MKKILMGLTVLLLVILTGCNTNKNNIENDNQSNVGQDTSDETIEAIEELSDDMLEAFTELDIDYNDLNNVYLADSYNQVSITWFSTNEERMTHDGDYIQSLNQDTIELVATLDDGFDTITKTFTLDINPDAYADNDLDIAIYHNLLPTNHIKLNDQMDPEYIVIHNTANTATATNEVAYLHNETNTSYTSYHFAVDEKNVYQGVSLNYGAYHSANTYYNANSIGIEVARSMNENLEYRDQATENAAQLTASLLTEYQLDISKVIRHKDTSGKWCPHDIMERYGWENFLDLVESYM